MSVINEYWSALERLQKGNPSRLKKGYSINNDSVALEAGRKRGSIKKSREGFQELIDAIKAASINLSDEKNISNHQLIKQKNKTNYYKDLYEQSVNRELMLLCRLEELETELEKYKNVTLIHD